MDRYLYRISTKRADVWSNKKPKPVYFVAESKEAVEVWARANLAEGLAVARVTQLARQVGGTVFVTV